MARNEVSHELDLQRTEARRSSGLPLERQLAVLLIKTTLVPGHHKKAVWALGAAAASQPRSLTLPPDRRRVRSRLQPRLPHPLEPWDLRSHAGLERDEVAGIVVMAALDRLATEIAS